MQKQNYYIKGIRKARDSIRYLIKCVIAFIDWCRDFYDCYRIYREITNTKNEG